MLQERALEQAERNWRSRSVGREALRFVRHRPLGALGGLLILGMVLTAVFAPVIAPRDPLAIDAAHRLLAPSREYWFGTDNYGRDVFTRIVHGARISLYVGVLAVIFGTTTGSLIGLASGYLGGKVDLTVQRFVDALQSIPTLALALAMVAALGQSLTNVIIAISITVIPGSARIVRSTALSVKERAFIEAARTMGATDNRILFIHLLPNCLAPYIVLATAELGSAILAEASLSFLGLGTPPPTPSWGRELSGLGRSFMEQAPWMAIFPGVAISLAVFGFNLFGDALRDVLDPRLRGTR